MRVSALAVMLVLVLGGCMATQPRGAASDTPLPDFDGEWDYGNPAATEEKFRAILAEMQGRAEAAYRAQLLSQIARAQGLQRHFAEAHVTLDEAGTLLREDMPTARVRCLLERGRVYNSANEPEKARPLFMQAWDLALGAALDAHAVDAAHMLAIVEGGDAALEWNMKALALAESSPDPQARRWRGSLHNNIGWTLHDQAEYDQALAHFHKALVVRREQGDEESIRIARWCIARCLRSLGRTAEALRIQRELEAQAGAAGASGYVHEEIGECLLALGQEEEATPHFARAYELLCTDPWLAEREPQRLARLKQLGDKAAADPVDLP